MSVLTDINCRICFIMCGKTAKDASEISDLYFNVTGYTIYTTDIPKKVCEECLEQLMTVQEFKGICESSEKYLEQQRQEKAKEKPQINPEEVVTSELNENLVKSIKTEPDDPLQVTEEPSSYQETPSSHQEEPSAIQEESSVAPLTFEEYLDYEHQLKSMKKRKVKASAPLKQKSFTLNKWNFNLLLNYFKISGRIPSKYDIMVLEYDEQIKNEFPLPKNYDSHKYEETSMENNIITCTYCPYKSGGSKAENLMATHWNSNKETHNLFKCYKANHKILLPCLDLLRLHDSESHPKELVLLRKLKCNFCDFSCCFEQNMKIHCRKMHSKMKFEKCDRCQIMFCCNDIKFQHIVFQCGGNGDPDTQIALQLPFISVIKSENIKKLLQDVKFAKTKPLFTSVTEHISLPSDPVKFENDSLPSNNSEPTLTELLGMKYSCDYCFYRTRSKLKLKHHMERLHIDNPQPITGNSTQNDTSDPHTVICEFCSKAFSSNYISRHITITHQTDCRSFQCHLCEKSFKTKASLQNHIEISHLNRKPHTCEFCNESFKHQSTLRFHLQKVHNKGPNYICSQCGREFFSPGSLQYHEACHLDVYTVPCPVPYCDKLCKSKIHLKKHQMDMHSQKPYPCPICGKVFSSAKYLKQHKFSHQPKSYFCPVCPRSFSVSHSMRKHVTDKHPEYEMPPSGTQLKHVQWNKVEDS